MSSDAALPSSSVSRQPTWSFKIQNFSTPQTYAAKSVVDSKGRETTITPSQITTVAKDARQDASDEQRRGRLVRKRRRLNKEEEEMKDQIAASVSANLEIDQIMALYPDTETPFDNQMDVVQRLLPYHIYQHPQHDLDKIRGLKGKSKVSEADLLREEIRETKFALECHRRFRSLEERMKKARLKPGHSATPVEQAILVERIMLEIEHSDNAALEQELSSSRAELDKILRAQRIAKAAANRATSATPSSTAINGTNPTAPYYGYAAPTFSTTSTPNYANYYNSYTYPYTQSFIPGIGYATSTKAGSTISGVSTFQSGAANQSQSALPESNPANNRTSAASSSVAPTRPLPVSIPLQLPVTSLPALQSLGILPVPKASLPAEPNPQPAAVLLGSSNNGTMLSLEINAALLQPPQMSGLAILLSSLVKMSGGPNSNGQTRVTNTNASQITPSAVAVAQVESDAVMDAGKGESN